ncbi:MAG: GAF domain-containing sensor histidine kinase [Planctomycetota bacterium]|nr:GAF domain-containing sensor histidine kinase [Planctomycetota bacterium]
MESGTTDADLLRSIEAAERMARGDFPAWTPESLRPAPDCGAGGDAAARLAAALAAIGRTVREKISLLEDLSKLTAHINEGRTLDEVLENVYAGFRRHIPYDRIGVALLEDGGERLRSRWVRSEAANILLGVGYAGRMRGSSLRDIIETGRPRVINDLEAYLRERPDSHATSLIVKEGMRSSLTCPLIASGKPVGFVFFTSMKTGTYRDAHVEVFLQIAGSLATIVEKADAYQRLAELNELKTRFLGIAAHDLRSPLAVVKSFLSILEAGTVEGDPARRKDLYGRMARACDRMLGLINDLLDVSAIESGSLKLERKPADLRGVLVESAEMSRLVADAKKIRLSVEIPPALPPVEIDAGRISQVLDNLLGNAIKFSLPGTTVTLRAEVRDGSVRVSVTDQGPGIPPEDLPKLFRPFGRAGTRPTGGEKSTGLGLAIVKKIIELHGGQVGVESEVGRGSSFFFSLPISGSGGTFPTDGPDPSGPAA